MKLLKSIGYKKPTTRFPRNWAAAEARWNTRGYRWVILRFLRGHPGGCLHSHVSTDGHRLLLGTAVLAEFNDVGELRVAAGGVLAVRNKINSIPGVKLTTKKTRVHLNGVDVHDQPGMVLVKTEQEELQD